MLSGNTDIVILYPIHKVLFNPRFKKFPALFYSSILALGCIILAFLKLRNWYIMSKQQPSNVLLSQGSTYNTQGKNPIIFNVKG